MQRTSSIQATVRRRLIGASLELIKDDEASGRKIGKEGLCTRYKRIRRTILRETWKDGKER